MVYRFKLVSDEVNGFSRTIDIDQDATFLDLANAVLDSVGYSKDEMTSFFICEDDWQKGVEITQFDMGSQSDQDIYLMGETPLSELLEDEGQKLIFVFDYLAERVFFMEFREMVMGKYLDAAEVVKAVGNPPKQKIDLDEIDQQVEAKLKQQAKDSELDMDFYGDSEYNEDELPEGFEDF